MSETSQVSPNVKNLAMPRGRLSFALMADDGTTKGEIDLGNVTGLELTNKVTYKDHETSQEGTVILDAKKIASQLYTVKFTPEERSLENMKLFFLGDTDRTRGSSKDLLSQTGASISGQALTIYLDRWIDLGKKYIKTGTIVIAAGSINVENMAAGTFAVDLENGLIMIKSNNAASFTDAQSTTVSFMYGTCALPMIVPRTTPIIGFMRYRGISEVGPRHLIEFWKVQISPDAALAMIKAQDYAGLSFSGDVYKDDASGTHSANPFFRITELQTATSYPS
jgi:hypothetical protein